MASPAWFAATEHVPAATRVMISPFVPLDVHTSGVVVEKVTGVRPELVVALTVTGGSASVLFARLAKLIVWFVLTVEVTTKLRLTVAAALYAGSPACVAATV